MADTMQIVITSKPDKGKENTMKAKDAKNVAVVHDEAGKAVGVVEATQPEKQAPKKPDLKVVQSGPQKPGSPEAKAPAPKKTAEKKSEQKKPAAKKEEAKQPEEKPVTVSFSRQTFQKDIAVAADFTSKNSTMPILTHILLDVDGHGHCKIVATDLEATWTKISKCTGQKMSRCVPAAILLKEIKALPATETMVELVFKGNIVTVNKRCKLFTLNADDFPKIPEVKKWTDLQLDNFNAGLKGVAAAMGDDDTRYVLNGVFLDLDAKKVVATDGHRLHFEGIRVRGDKAASVIIPSRAVGLMMKYPVTEIPKLPKQEKPAAGDPSDPKKPAKLELDVFGLKVKVGYEPDRYGAQIEYKGPVNDTGYKSEWLPPHEQKDLKAVGLKAFLQKRAEELYLTYNKTVGITVSDKFMTYPAAGGEMLVKIVEGTYPKYSEIIPKSSPVKVRFSAKEFLQNMQGAIPLTNEAVTLRINSGLTIQSQSAERGDYSWKIPCQAEGKDKGTHIDVKFSAKYLVDAIKAFAPSEVLLEMSDSEKPCLFNQKAVVMPMRLK